MKRFELLPVPDDAPEFVRELDAGLLPEMTVYADVEDDAEPTLDPSPPEGAPS